MNIKAKSARRARMLWADRGTGRSFGKESWFSL